MNPIPILIVGATLLLGALKVGEPWKAPTEADALKSPVANDPKALVRGTKLFNAYCWQCHGVTGKGDGPGAANLKVKPADLGSAPVQSQTDGAIFWKLSNGRGEMQPFQHTLGKEERWFLVSYIRSLNNH